MRTRGFTLLEVVVALAAMGILAPVVMRSLVEFQARAAAQEARVRQRREAGLALDWLGHDLRQAREVETGATLVARGPDGEVRWHADGALRREDGRAPLRLAGGVREASFAPVAGGLRVRLVLDEQIDRFRVRTVVDRTLVWPGGGR